MVLLGIDYGKSRVGLAIAVKSIVLPYKTLTKKDQKELINKLKQICEQENVDKIILGLPGGKLVPEIKGFGKKLNKMVRLPVIEVNEVMTSWEAEKKLGKVEDKEKVDQVAAALILERYLDEQGS
jgi:putative transcription antitermination factor YqgF